MKFVKYCIACGILLAPTLASADWKLLVVGNQSKLYVETDKIKPVGKMIKAWFMEELSEPAKFGKKYYRSIKSYEVYDCENERKKVEYMVIYSDGMGSGEVVRSMKGDEWKFVVPGSFLAASFEKICKR